MTVIYHMVRFPGQCPVSAAQPLAPPPIHMVNGKPLKPLETPTQKSALLRIDKAVLTRWVGRVTSQLPGYTFPVLVRSSVGVDDETKKGSQKAKGGDMAQC